MTCSCTLPPLEYCNLCGAVVAPAGPENSDAALCKRREYARALVTDDEGLTDYLPDDEAGVVTQACLAIVDVIVAACADIEDEAEARWRIERHVGILKKAIKRIFWELGR